LESPIDKLLSNGKYVTYIIDMEAFMQVQYEKADRSNVNYDSGERKVSRFSSNNELSGFLICNECGSRYRRITRSSGEVVWRCVNRVEHGNKTCKNAPTISDQCIKSCICKELNLDEYDLNIIRGSLKAVYIGSDSIEVQRKANKTQAVRKCSPRTGSMLSR
jgi:hypothetical protein